MAMKACTVGPSPRGWGDTETLRLRTSLRADHPHAGGENSTPCAEDRMLPGPSPRGWGERLQIAAMQRERRTIPTRVGRTFNRRSQYQRTTDHPHARGENGDPRRFRLFADGPSPRGWGEPAEAQAKLEIARTIPTRVGRHPHLARYVNAFTGPSPRGWGERLSPCRSVRAARTIPTRVGRTRRDHFEARTAADHPHARGENIGNPGAVWRWIGPSPRAWGEPRTTSGECA